MHYLSQQMSPARDSMSNNQQQSPKQESKVANVTQQTFVRQVPLVNLMIFELVPENRIKWGMSELYNDILLHVNNIRS